MANINKIYVKYTNDKLTKLAKTENGDCIDLRVENVKINNGDYFYNNCNCDGYNIPCRYKKGDIVFVSFGVILQVANNKRINVYSRSSTFKKYGLILTNGIGIIDNSYKGENDIICGMFYALKDGSISFDERIAQFEVVNRMVISGNEDIVEIEGELSSNSRGGYGSSGTK